MSTRYVKTSAIKQAAHGFGKRVAPSFIDALDRYVEQKLIAACKEHNGGVKTLNAEIARLVGLV